MDDKEFNIILKRIEEKESHLKREGEIVPSKEELIKETIGERIEKALEKAPPTSIEKAKEISSKLVSNQATFVLTPYEQKKIHELVDIAFKKGIPQAVKLVLKTGNYHLIDTFHDKLVEKYIEKNLEKEL